MNMHRIRFVIPAAMLFAGFAAPAAHAQTGTFASGIFSVAATSGDVTGTGVGTFSGIINSPATLTLSATGSSANDFFGTISESLTNVDVTIVAGGNTTTITGATGNLVVSSGDLVAFTDATLGTVTTTYPGLTVSSLGFNFTASPTPGVTGGTHPVAGVTLNGALTAFGGTDGVVTIGYTSSVPEPGMVSMLVGLAVTGTGFAVRRQRRRTA